MSNLWQVVFLCLGLLVTMTACAVPDIRLHSYGEYLNQAVGHADHDVVAKKMGAPNRRLALDTGGDLWTYEFCHRTTDSLGDPSSNGIVTYPTGYCQNLTLVFENSGKLAEWRDTRVQTGRP
jgi:hypothetical protein